MKPYVLHAGRSSVLVRALACLAFLAACPTNGRSQNASQVAAIRTQAEEGNAVSQNSLGICYFEALGMETNYVEAAKWFRKAADRGLPEAQYNLGLCYTKGFGVERNYLEATNWYQKAEKQFHRRKIKNTFMSVAKWTLIGAVGVFLLFALLRRLLRVEVYVSANGLSTTQEIARFVGVIVGVFALFIAVFVDLPMDDDIAFRKAERYVKDHAPIGVEVNSDRNKPYISYGRRAIYVFYLRSPGVKEQGKVEVVVYKRAMFYFAYRE